MRKTGRPFFSLSCSGTGAWNGTVADGGGALARKGASGVDVFAFAFAFVVVVVVAVPVAVAVAVPVEVVVDSP
jgi:hypothetical protein